MNIEHKHVVINSPFPQALPNGTIVVPVDKYAVTGWYFMKDSRLPLFDDIPSSVTFVLREGEFELRKFITRS